jgi:PAS domain S-box-containing protein
MDADQLYRRYQELQAYIGWTPEDAARVKSIASIVAPAFPQLIDDFYAEIERHEGARKVITGGTAQIERLKGTLHAWINELFRGPYDRNYVSRRWRVGLRHVEIGLDQVYTNMALSRLRTGLTRVIVERWQGNADHLQQIKQSLHKLVDLDLAIIEDAYQAEYLARMQRAEREFADNLIETAQAVVLVLDARGRIVRFNRYLQEISGQKLEDIRGGDWVERFVPSPERERARDVMERTLADRETRGVCYRIQVAGDAVREFQWSGKRLHQPDGTLLGVLMVGVDISDLRDSQQRALRAEQLAAIGQMMTVLAHESGNALARSRAFLDNLAHLIDDRPDALQLIDRIYHAQDQLQQLYQEIRNYASPLHLDRANWSLQLIWRQAWHNLTIARQGRQATLVEKPSGVDPKCSVDSFRVEQVFRNLFENSLAACADPVRIDIEMEDADIDGTPALRIRVRDNGPGVDWARRQKAFEPFFTTKQKGTGLGLAIARRNVEAHGGRIDWGAADGPGAEIVILLPRREP